MGYNSRFNNRTIKVKTQVVVPPRSLAREYDQKERENLSIDRTKRAEIQRVRFGGISPEPEPEHRFAPTGDRLPRMGTYNTRSERPQRDLMVKGFSTKRRNPFTMKLWR